MAKESIKLLFSETLHSWLESKSFGLMEEECYRQFFPHLVIVNMGQVLNNTKTLFFVVVMFPSSSWQIKFFYFKIEWLQLTWYSYKNKF